MLRNFCQTWRSTIAGLDNTHSLLERLDTTVINANVSVVILYIGGNDVTQDLPIESIIQNIGEIIDKITRSNIRLYVFSLLPKGLQFGQRNKYIDLAQLNRKIYQLNRKIGKLCQKKSVMFWDISFNFSGKHGELRGDFTNDGTHLNAKGYLQFETEIVRLVGVDSKENKLKQKPLRIVR